MIIYNYSKDWKRLSSYLFILIAAADIGSACFEIARGSIALQCLHDESFRMQHWIYTTYISLGLFCYVTSTFFGMVLTVVKTINIVNPFYRIRGRVLKTCIAILSSLGFLICVVDIGLLCKSEKINVFNNTVSCSIGPWFAIFKIRLVGAEISVDILSSLIQDRHLMTVMYILLAQSLLFLEFILPCLIVLVCMVLQIFHIRRALRESADPRENTANHITTTIFLISLLYLLSISIYSVHLCLENFMNWILAAIKTAPSFMVAKYTLPLVNAALFPTILILRKRELRARYKGYISTLLHLPVNLFYNIRHRRRGYTDI